MGHIRNDGVRYNVAGPPGEILDAIGRLGRFSACAAVLADDVEVTVVRPQRRNYDPRLRQLVREGGGDELVRALAIPRTTIAGWRRSSRKEIVTAEAVDLDSVALHMKVAVLERRVQTLTMILGLLLMLVRVSRARLDERRLPDGEDKAALLRAVGRARSGLALRSILRIIGLSSTRYWAWKRASECKLDDEGCCPKSRPMSLTPDEV